MDAAEARANYARLRYESARQALTEFRSWSRQIALKIAAAVGVELTLATLLFKFVTDASGGRWSPALVVGLLGELPLALVVLWQFWLYGKAVALGYEVHGFEHPRAPDALVADVRYSGADADRIHALLAEEYSRGCEKRREQSALVAEAVRKLSRDFIDSLLLAFLLTLLAFAATLAASASRPQPAQSTATGQGPVLYSRWRAR
jgi:hypothetical protein